MPAWTLEPGHGAALLHGHRAPPRGGPMYRNGGIEIIGVIVIVILVLLVLGVIHL